MNNVFYCLILLSCYVPVYGNNPSRTEQPIEENDTILLQSVENTDTTFMNVSLEEFVVHANQRQISQTKSSQNVVHVGTDYIEQHFSGSLMQSLQAIPGIKAMSIGSGQSKPAIRGFGFNRMIVAENGIKHEGQQWGEEHGLEMDQFAIDEIEIIKGPSSLMYGSDAIGGVINIRNNSIPERTAEGKVNLFARSNNASLGASTRLQGRKNRFYYKAYFTLVDYADYQVPTDYIQYHSYNIALKDKMLRNTAGEEKNSSLSVGYLGDSFKSAIHASNTYAKSGFFANAHGLEVRLSQIDYDQSSRDIDLPYHNVNHFKVQNHSVWQLAHAQVTGNFAYQKNQREEFSERVSHGYMPVPPDTLEREFNKDTYTGDIALKTVLAEKHQLTVGVKAEYQSNKRGGWGFVIPDFQSSSFGTYIHDRYYVTGDLIVNAGVRFDGMITTTNNYSDWYQTPDENGNYIYTERASEMRKTFNSVTWAVGANYNRGAWNLKANIGKSFRTPIPKELASDGVNYHLFRYEKGRADLSPEVSYQADAGIDWCNEKLEILIEPYLNYFPNYIYMNPTSEYHEGLQLYRYTQSKVLRYGFEATFCYRFSEKVSSSLTAEYLYAEQLSGEKKGYTLPFSPPYSGMIGITYTPKTSWAGEDGFVSLDYRIVGEQNKIVPPERKTKGYQTLDISIGRNWNIDKCQIKASIRGENLLNKKYYDHTSYYRLIDVPEPGRHCSIMIGLSF